MGCTADTFDRWTRLLVEATETAHPSWGMLRIAHDVERVISTELERELTDAERRCIGDHVGY